MTPLFCLLISSGQRMFCIHSINAKHSLNGACTEWLTSSIQNSAGQPQIERGSLLNGRTDSNKNNNPSPLCSKSLNIL